MALDSRSDPGPGPGSNDHIPDVVIMKKKQTNSTDLLQEFPWVSKAPPPGGRPHLSLTHSPVISAHTFALNFIQTLIPGSFTPTRCFKGVGSEVNHVTNITWFTCRLSRLQSFILTHSLASSHFISNLFGLLFG